MRQVVAQPKGNLGFDPEAAIVAGRELGSAMMNLACEDRTVAGFVDPAELLHNRCRKPDLVAGDDAPSLPLFDFLKYAPNGVSFVEVCRIKIRRQYLDGSAPAEQFDDALGLFPHVKFGHLYSPRSFYHAGTETTESYSSPGDFALNPLGCAVRAARSFRWRRGAARLLYRGPWNLSYSRRSTFISAHSSWAFPVMFVTAFGESFAFLSLLFPGTSILIVAGTLMSAGSLPYWPVLVGAVIGAVLGDSVSFWLGHRYGGGIGRIWPFTRNPDLLPNGIRFFQKHGGKSVFIGRFFGPVRAVIPLAAGIMQMRRGRFWFANVTSAIVWAPMLLFAGDAVGDVGDRLIGSANTVLLVFGGLTVFGIIAIVWAMVKSGRSRS